MPNLFDVPSMQTTRFRVHLVSPFKHLHPSAAGWAVRVLAFACSIVRVVAETDQRVEKEGEEEARTVQQSKAEYTRVLPDVI